MARANGKSGRDVMLELMTTVAELKRSMHDQSDTMRALSDGMSQLSSRMSQLSSRMRSSETQFGRLAKLLGEFAERTQDRFDDFEQRVSRLEASGK